MAARHLKFLRKRTAGLLIIFLALFIAIAGRLFYIQVMDNGRYCKLADKLRRRELVVPANRGVVYDRKERQLAANIPACAVYVQPKRMKAEEKKHVAETLAAITGMDESAVEKVLFGRSSFAYIGRQLSSEIGDKVKSADLPGVGVLTETKRVYPSGSLAAHILGFTNIDGHGLEGIERSSDKLLTGHDGCTIAEVDQRGRIIPETRRQWERARDGNDVVLTIDAYLQHVTEDALFEKGFKAHNAAGATAIVLDPHTGEVLALANCPTYDPNNHSGLDAAVWRNRAVTDLYEPGSTMKLITVSAGMESGISPTEVVATCTRAGMPLGKRRIRCTLHAPWLAGHGGVNMYGIIRDSCNIGAASIALRIGPDKMDSYVRAFGMLDKPGSGMAGETMLGLGDPASWAAIKLANVGFGQGIAVSALQMADAYAVIANGGKLMKPQIIREVWDQDGKVTRPFSPVVVRRVVSEETARRATEMLMGCVDEGTGKTARIDGYTVAGKTGSAQKASLTGRGYASGKFVASFIGFVPAKDPKLVICVAVDEPQGSHWGATCAGPVFQDIAQKAMLYLRVPPDQPVEPDGKPAKGLKNAKRVHEKLGAGHTG